MARGRVWTPHGLRWPGTRWAATWPPPDTGSYEQFAQGYFLTREGMKWFWDQYTTDPAQRSEITASPLRADTDQLAGVPRALVITGEADVLRDEGEAYADKLRMAGVPVTAMRMEGIIHDFAMLDALRGAHAARAAMTMAVDTLRTTLRAHHEPRPRPARLPDGG